MDTPKTKIAFYKKRSFGDKLNACFDFIKENWKPLLKFSTYLILPLCMLQSLTLNGFMSSYMTLMGEMNLGVEDFPASFIMQYLLTIVWMMIGSLIMYSLVYSLMQLYNSRENGLEGLKFAELKPVLFKNIKRYLIVFLFLLAIMIVAMVVIVGLAFLLLPTLFLTLGALVIVAIPLALFLPIYMFEDIPLLEAFKKTFKLGFATFGGILGISIVAGLIASVVQGATTTPWYIGMVIKTFFTLSEGGAAAGDSFLYTFGMYLLGILQTYGTYISMIISIIAIAYQYAHANEVVNGVSIKSDIENFDQLV